MVVNVSRFLQMLMKLMWGPKPSRGGQGEMEPNLKMTLCDKLILLEGREFSMARGHTGTNERSRKLPVTFRSPLCPFPLRSTPLPTCSIKSLDKTCHYRQTLDFIRWQDGDRVKYIALLLSNMNLNKHGCTYWTQTITQLDWTWKTKCHPSKMALKGLFVFKYTKHIQISHCFTCPHWVNYKKFSVLSYFFKVSDQWEVLQG